MIRFIVIIQIVLLFAVAINIGAQESVPVGWHWALSGAVDIAGLDSLRQKALASGDTNAEAELCNTFCNEVNTLHFDLSDEAFIRKYLTDAEILTHARYYRPENSLFFEVMADCMLSRLTDTLKYAINAGLADKQDPAVIYIIQRLADNRMYVDIRVSNLCKTFTYLREGRFRYVFHKLTTTYKAELFRFLSAFFFLVALFFYRKRITNALKTD